MYEHIAYELRYEDLSSIEHDSICMKSTIYLITLIELFVHIDRKKHSLRVLTLCETTKDKLANMLVSKSQSIGWTPPKYVHLVFESPNKCMHNVYDNNEKFTL